MAGGLGHTLTGRLVYPPAFNHFNAERGSKPLGVVGAERVVVTTSRISATLYST